MKRIFLTLLFMLGLFAVQADEPIAEIAFDKTVHNFGTFSEKDGVVKCTFTFKNIGDAPLVVNQVLASCGCTTSSFTEKPVEPGKTGEILITYNGKGFPTGKMRKLITVRTNGKTRIVKLYIEGEMTK